MVEASILLLEDSSLDAELVQARLEQAGFTFQLECVDSRRGFETAVSSRRYDIILADHTLPDYDGRTALNLTRSLGLDTPFIFVSGTLGEELAVDMLKSGANDYVLKQRLERLVPAVREALKLVAERREKRRIEEELRLVEQRYRQLFEDAPDGIFIADERGLLQEANRSGCQMLGYTELELIGKPVADFMRSDDQNRLEQVRAELADAGAVHTGEWELLRRDGAPLPVEVKVRTLTDGRAQAFVRDIRERKQTETALRDADRRKDEFLAMLAHELRNPLAPIRNALHVLKLQGPHDPTIDQTAKIMTRQVDHMVRLVDDLLDVSRITRGKITLRRESIVLNDVAARAIEAARPLIDARRHALDVELPTDELCLRADGNRLAQVITNLLINAAKFTPENGNLKLSIRRSVDEAIITVSDDGVGIAPDALRSIFDLFVQADATLDRAQGGLGIGLTLVRSIVEMHGGRVEVQSAGVGLGSTFTVTLPADRRQSTPSSNGAPPVASLGTNALRRRLRVLIVDDNHDSAATLAAVLRLWGCDVVSAYDGVEALRLAGERKPHLILLDLGLPGMNGFEVIRQIRKSDEFADICVAAVTGYGAEEDRRRTAETGFQHHLVKPVDTRDLQDVLLGLVGRIDAALDSNRD